MKTLILIAANVAGAFAIPSAAEAGDGLHGQCFNRGVVVQRQVVAPARVNVQVQRRGIFRPARVNVNVR